MKTFWNPEIAGETMDEVKTLGSAVPRWEGDRSQAQLGLMQSDFVSGGSLTLTKEKEAKLAELNSVKATASHTPVDSCIALTQRLTPHSHRPV